MYYAFGIPEFLLNSYYPISIHYSILTVNPKVHKLANWVFITDYYNATLMH
jgi:hypothetical protein